MLDEEFNQAVMAFSLVCWPEGYERTSEQYESFEAMREAFRTEGRIKINTNFSEQTIFENPEVNWDFRAWHDWCHLWLDAGFDREGETKAAELQKRMLDLSFPSHPKLEFWKTLIDIEVVGQLEYYLQNGAFVSNQIEFAHEQLRQRGY